MIGRTLGQYRIVSRLGAGGMGVVFRAVDERLDREVAIKVLPAGALADENDRRRFRREAQALSRLNHPNIATVYDFNHEEGVDFLVTELIAGKTLAERIAAGPIPENELLAIASQIAAALEEAHERGVIHRDLKPANVIVGPKGHIKVLDFGLAKLIEPASGDPMGATMTLGTESAVGTTSGTLAYMAPEQLSGGEIDVRTDIWGLGVVLYEMACQKRPFDGTTATVVGAAILTQPPVEPCRANASTSLRLQEIILKCLEKSPDDRYQSVRELSTDLRRLQTPRSSTSVPLQPLAARDRGIGTGRRTLVLAVVALVLLAVGVALWRNLSGRSASLSPIRSIAVLPLDNLSGDAAQDFMADGLTEALIADLSKVGALKVISRTSVMQYKGAKRRLRDIANELGVDGVVEGSVLREGDSVRVTVQLIDGRNDQHVWAQNYFRKFDSVLSLQTEVARTIAEEINVSLSPREKHQLARVTAADPRAQETYLLGLYELRHTPTREGRERAVKLFEQVLAIDSSFARAQAALAESYIELSNTYRAPHDTMPKAREAAQKALQIDDSLAEAYAVLGTINLKYEWDWQGAENNLKRAIERNPNLAGAHIALAEYLATRKRFDEAVQHVRRAYELDPLSPALHGRAMWVLFFSRRCDEGLNYYQRTRTVTAKFGAATSVAALCMTLLGRSSQAVAAADEARQTSDAPITYAVAAQVYALNGVLPRSKALLKDVERLAQDKYVCPYNAAHVYLAQKEFDKAYEWFTRAYRERSD